MSLIRSQDRSHRVREVGWLWATGLIGWERGGGAFSRSRPLPQGAYGWLAMGDWADGLERGDGALSRSRPLPQGACGGLAGDWADWLGWAVMVFFRGQDRSHEVGAVAGRPCFRGSGLDRESDLRTAAAFIFRSTR